MTAEQMNEDFRPESPSGSRDGAGVEATAALTGILPEVLDGHWTTADGRDMALRYVNQPRSAIGFADHNDFSLANAVFLADRNSLDLIVMQTAAKDRIRWLSANLAMAREYVEIANRDIAKAYSENQTLAAKLDEIKKALAGDHEVRPMHPDRLDRILDFQEHAGQVMGPNDSASLSWADQRALIDEAVIAFRARAAIDPALGGDA